jgi:hypothetical protein
MPLRSWQNYKLQCFPEREIDKDTFLGFAIATINGDKPSFSDASSYRESLNLVLRAGVGSAGTVESDRKR